MVFSLSCLDLNLIAGRLIAKYAFECFCMKSVTTEITERIATPDDVLILLEIEQSAFPPERWASEPTLRNRLQLADSVTWLAYLNGKPAGFSNGFPIRDISTQEGLDPADSELYSEDGNCWLLRNVAVHKSLQRCGVGKQLVQLQIQAAREYGSKYFRFTATENLTSYYSELGFQMVRPAKVFHGLPQAVWELTISQIPSHTESKI